MTCPICGNICHERHATAAYFIQGKNWVYTYSEFVCNRHGSHRWQTDEQTNAAMNEIDKIKRAAEKLKKAQT